MNTCGNHNSLSRVTFSLRNLAFCLEIMSMQKTRKDTDSNSRCNASHSIAVCHFYIKFIECKSKVTALLVTGSTLSIPNLLPISTECIMFVNFHFIFCQ